MTVTAITAERLRFTYDLRTDASRWAIDGVSLSVAPGEFWGVIGPNGSGKSSLLKLFAKLFMPTEGQMTLFGTPLTDMKQDEVARQVALVPQETLQLFPFTLAEMVLMGRYPHHVRAHRLRPLSLFGWENEEDRRLAIWAMEQTDVAHLGRRRVQEVSGGERQRAMIARALAQGPRILLLDEPTAFLDLNHQVDTCRILRRLNEQQGLTIVLVSHDLNLASQYCDRMLLLDRGRAIKTGMPREVVDADLLATVYGCRVLVDSHPTSGLPRVTLPGRDRSSAAM